jgi:hypothetical protein
MNRKMVHFHLPTPGQDSLAVDRTHTILILAAWVLSVAWMIWLVVVAWRVRDSEPRRLAR